MAVLSVPLCNSQRASRTLLPVSHSMHWQMASATRPGKPKPPFLPISKPHSPIFIRPQPLFAPLSDHLWASETPSVPFWLLRLGLRTRRFLHTISTALRSPDDGEDSIPLHPLLSLPRRQLLHDLPGEQPN